MYETLKGSRGLYFESLLKEQSIHAFNFLFIEETVFFLCISKTKPLDGSKHIGVANKPVKMYFKPNREMLSL